MNDGTYFIDIIFFYSLVWLYGFTSFLVYFYSPYFELKALIFTVSVDLSTVDLCLV